MKSLVVLLALSVFWVPGEVNGQKVTWQFKTGPNDTLTATQTGKLDARGTTIVGTWHLNRDKDTDGKFTATKQ